MKNTINHYSAKVATTFALLFISCLTFAQDLDIDVDLNKDNEWYKNPWYLVGIGAFIIILVLALRSTSSKK